MKKIGFIILGTVLSSKVVFADVIIVPPVSAPPPAVELQQQGQIYVPNDIIANDIPPDVYPVQANGRLMNCYPSNPPTIPGMQPTELSISLGGRIQRMECYFASPLNRSSPVYRPPSNLPYYNPAYNPPYDPNNNPTYYPMR